MKLIAFTVGGYPIQVPKQIAAVNSHVGLFGANIFKLAVDILIYFGIFLCLFFVFFGGFKWLISQGDKKKIEEAHNTIIYAVMGLFVIFLAFLVINVLGAFFNVPILSLH